MVLVLLTERHPYEAIGITLRRLSFLLLPASVLFVRYYPDLGRGYRANGGPCTRASASRRTPSA